MAKPSTASTTDIHSAALVGLQTCFLVRGEALFEVCHNRVLIRNVPNETDSWAEAAGRFPMPFGSFPRPILGRRHNEHELSRLGPRGCGLPKKALPEPV